MSECRVCGIEFREGDDIVALDGQHLHAGCVETHPDPPRRKVGSWAAMGSQGQMAMGDVQRDTPS